MVDVERRDPLRAKMNAMSQRIVVGIDGSDESVVALTWAVEEAERRAATVLALMAWNVPGWLALEGGGRPEQERLASELRDAAAATLARVVEPVVGERTVTVEQSTVEGNPVPALVHASGSADLLVVGARGLGGFRGLLLGSVSAQLLHHARCPVVVVPRGTERR